MLPFGLGALVCLCALVYAWFEAGWLRTRTLEVPLSGLPAALDGMRIAHLSDFHLGAPLSRGNGASARAADWVASRRPDLVCVTGDLVSHPRGERRLHAVLARLDRPFVVLGNHDVAWTRDPFSRTEEWPDLENARMLRDAEYTLELRGCRIAVVGVDPVSFRRRRASPSESVVSEDAEFRILLCHFPEIVERLQVGSFGLILTGHLHAGQICLPLPGRRLTLAHPGARYVSGLYRTPAGTMHVAPGTGTTFVPFRFFARPEATELILVRRPQ